MNSSALFFNVRALWPPKPVARHRGVARWHAFTEHALDRQNMNVAQRLLAPMLVNRRSYGPAQRLRDGVGIATPRPRQALHGRYHDVVHDLIDDLSGRILFRDPDEINLGIVGQFALFSHGNRDENAAGEGQSAPFDHRARLGILQYRAVLVEPSRRQLLDDGGIARPQFDEVTVAADQGLRHADGTRQAGMLEQMQRFAAHGNQQLRADPGN